MYISASETITPNATDTVYFAGNLDNRFPTWQSDDDTVSRTVQVYDSRGREQTIVVDLKQLGGNEWEWDANWLLVSEPIAMDNGEIANNGEYELVGNNLVEVVSRDSDGIPTHGDIVATTDDGRQFAITDSTGNITHAFEFEHELSPGEPVNAFSDGGSLFLSSRSSLTSDVADPTHRVIEFNPNGSFLKLGADAAHILKFKPADAEDLEIELDFTEFTQYADTFTGKFMHQNGYTSGALESYAIDQNGVIVGSFSNGLTRALGQVALARFANPAGLQRSGSTMFIDTPNSGTAQVGAAGIPGFGQISPSSLEMSNVDLSEEFTEMIITQRGFQANSRIITTSDEMLQELVNLKR
ncbi:MAG TPA: flagellar hook-basal body complex protein, partial [Limnochordia bacterium]|nr:flagellar hook-basal body complex protein [Limnochordia bacterium]